MRVFARESGKIRLFFRAGRWQGPVPGAFDFFPVNACRLRTLSWEIMDKAVVAVVGLGYVGLPLAVEFGKRYRTIGFDLSEQKVANYKKHIDTMGEVDAAGFAAAVHFEPTTDASRLKEADFVIVAVPTPIGRDRRPDLSPVESASRIVGCNLKPGAVVVFESTVYPGVTEEVCVPILERESGLAWRKVLARAHQPWRQGAYHDPHHQGGGGRLSGNLGQGRRALRFCHQGGRAPLGDRQGRGFGKC
ncbi:UDP-N-acetyl-D-mannosamine dehydrogenase [anaerobic digester metagenome]